MAMLSIILECHDLSAVAAYFGLLQNHAFLLNSIVCLETCQENATDELRPFSAADIQYIISSFCTDPEKTNASQKALFPLLTGHQHVYPIDNLLGDENVHRLLDAIAEQHNVRKDYLDRLTWLRDKCMATGLIELLSKQPHKNIILVTGQLHYGIVYHLLSLLPPHLAQTQIRLLNLASTTYDIDAYKSALHDFYYQQLPVPLISFDDMENDASLCSLESLIRIPNISICPTRLARFKMHYEYRDLDYRMIRNALTTICQTTAQVIDASHAKQLSDAQERVIMQILRQSVIHFSQLPIPADILGSLLGSELLPKPRLKLPYPPLGMSMKSTPIKGRPSEFMTRYYSS